MSGFDASSPDFSSSGKIKKIKQSIRKCPFETCKAQPIRPHVQTGQMCCLQHYNVISCADCNRLLKQATAKRYDGKRCSSCYDAYLLKHQGSSYPLNKSTTSISQQFGFYNKAKDTLIDFDLMNEKNKEE